MKTRTKYLMQVFLRTLTTTWLKIEMRVAKKAVRRTSMMKAMIFSIVVFQLS